MCIRDWEKMHVFFTAPPSSIGAPSFPKDAVKQFNDAYFPIAGSGSSHRAEKHTEQWAQKTPRHMQRLEMPLPQVSTLVILVSISYYHK